MFSIQLQYKWGIFLVSERGYNLLTENNSLHDLVKLWLGFKDKTDIPSFIGNRDNVISTNFSDFKGRDFQLPLGI